MKALVGVIALISAALVVLSVYTLLPVAAPAIPFDAVNLMYVVSALVFLLMLIGGGAVTNRMATKRTRPT